MLKPVNWGSGSDVWGFGQVSDVASEVSWRRYSTRRSVQKSSKRRETRDLWDSERWEMGSQRQRWWQWCSLVEQLSGGRRQQQMEVGRR